MEFKEWWDKQFPEIKVRGTSHYGVAKGAWNAARLDAVREIHQFVKSRQSCHLSASEDASAIRRHIESKHPELKGE